MKKPEAIKKGLEYCKGMACGTIKLDCPYDGVRNCSDAVLSDALAYIQQLENEVLAWNRIYSMIHNENGVVQRELDHQRELLEKDVEIRRMEEANLELEAQVPVNRLLDYVDREKTGLRSKGMRGKDT